MSEIGLIGAGQLGSRHLQALARLPSGTRVHVADPMAASLDTARARFAEIQDSPVEVSYGTTLDDWPASLDIGIIATGARERRAVVEQLLSARKVRHLILEKFLFQRAEDYRAVAELLAARGATGWVNCPRRLWPLYRSLHEQIRGPVQIMVSGSDWGLACNAIHFLDLAAWLGRDDEWRFFTTSLDAGTRPSRRPGYLEVTGTLTGVGERGSRVVLTSHSEGALPLVLTIEADGIRYVVRESENRAWMQALAGQWQWAEVDAPARYQSQLTDGVVSELLTTDTCGLAPLAASTRHHLALLDALQPHMGVEPCPIT